MVLSVNERAFKIIDEILSDPERFRVSISTLDGGSTVIDAGINVDGGIEVGLKITEICMGGLGKATISYESYGEYMLPTVVVSTDHPAIALLGSQLAGWSVKVGDFFAVGSGPIRALALKPKKLYERIGYRDEAEVGVMVLETDKLPSREVAKEISEKSGVKEENLYLIVVPDNCLAGMTQIAGRIVETGLYRLDQLGFNVNEVIHGSGYAPVMPIHPDSTKSMGRANDSLFYAGVTSYLVESDDDESLKSIIEKSPSSVARDYGKPFYEIYKEAGFDFYKIDTSLFAPAYISVTNLRTGSTFKAGRINLEVLIESIKGI